eukprot:scaffold187950_cov44-Attheya_sp.AAC.3
MNQPFLLLLASLEQFPASKEQEQNFLNTIQTIILSPLPEYDSSMFTFEMNRQAARKNWTVLHSFNGNLKEALAVQQTTQLVYGSEFRPPERLEPLFSSHVLWPNMKAILSNGATFPLEPLDEERFERRT